VFNNQNFSFIFFAFVLNYSKKEMLQFLCKLKPFMGLSTKRCGALLLGNPRERAFRGRGTACFFPTEWKGAVHRIIEL